MDCANPINTNTNNIRLKNNPNTNIIQFEKITRIRIRILFGLRKSPEYEYEYYSIWKYRPNKIRIFWYSNIIRILEAKYLYSYSGDFLKPNIIRIRIHGICLIQIIFVIILIFVVLSFFGGTSLFDGTNLLNGLVEENRINAKNATMPWGHILNTQPVEKSNKCNKCDYAYSNTGNLQSHLKIHSG